MIEPGHPRLSIVRQCELVSISRASFYYEPSGETPLNLTLMRLIDEQFLETPFYGTRQMARHLRRQGYTVGRKRVRRLMARMGLAAIYQRPRTSDPHPAHAVYKYLLRNLMIDRPNQVSRAVLHGTVRVSCSALPLCLVVSSRVDRLQFQSTLRYLPTAGSREARRLAMN